MAASSRREVVRPEEVGVYHCWSRCVRRAFLCGLDPLTKIDFSDRRDWIVDFEEELAALFGIEVGFHGELANHIHLVIRNRPDVVDTWSDEEVARRWLTITRLVKSKDGVPVEISQGQIRLEVSDPERVAVLRVRLADPSCFMGALEEHIARRANLEEGVSGHFWEDRYGCRRLESDAAILTAGLYIDLNQIRAGEAETPETSTHTSAHQRILTRLMRDAAREAGKEVAEIFPSAPDGWMCELTLQAEHISTSEASRVSVTGRRASDKGLLPVTIDQYLTLLDTVGRTLGAGKLGAIPAELAPILERLEVQVDRWYDTVAHFHERFGRVVGSSAQLLESARAMGRRWLGGLRHCREAFG